MVWPSFRRWYCWVLLLFFGQVTFLVTSAFLHVLYRSHMRDLAEMTTVASTVAMVEEAEEEIVEEPETTTEPSVPLMRAWHWKYGAGSTRATAKPDAWVLCPGKLKKREITALKPKLGKSFAISLNKYFYPPVWANYGLTPTHHWHAESESIVNGFCLKELKKAQKELAKRPAKDPTRITVMKFESGYGECYIAQEIAMAAAKSGIKFISTKPVIKLLRSMKIPPLTPILHEEREWQQDHPLPLALGDPTLLHGISIAVSLTPRGSTIKLVGCDGFGGKKDIKLQAKKIREHTKLLEKAGPGWDVVNCDPKSEYVKLGAMPAVSCFDARDSEYDLERMSNMGNFTG